MGHRSAKMVTKAYSTSFSMGILGLDKKLHQPIYNIYGFVRFADEIVDTFHDYDKSALLNRFREDTWLAIEQGISLNPILNAFQETVRAYNIDRWLIETFLDSMEMDLKKSEYDKAQYDKYILGSAEVVGLMCLKVFVEGDEQQYKDLEYNAMKLGSAFQKINFLRDISTDFNELGRTYFPGVDLTNFDDQTKTEILDDIASDFNDGFVGIKKLPKGARFGVYIAYVYYYNLFLKIKQTHSEKLFTQRIRVSNKRKVGLFVSSYFRHSFNLL